jgi:hypothetical protein
MSKTTRPLTRAEIQHAYAELLTENGRLALELREAYGTIERMVNALLDADHFWPESVDEVIGRYELPLDGAAFVSG